MAQLQRTAFGMRARPCSGLGACPMAGISQATHSRRHQIADTAAWATWRSVILMPSAQRHRCVELQGRDRCSNVTARSASDAVQVQPGTPGPCLPGDPDAKAIVSEFLGVFVLQFFCAASPEQLAAPVAGLVTAVAVFAFNNLSGALFNPAISVLFVLTKQATWRRMLFYLPAQVLGAVLGTYLVTILVPGCPAALSGAAGPGCYLPAQGLSSAALFGWEVLMVFVLGTVVHAVCVMSANYAAVSPMVVGLTVTMLVYAGNDYTGCVLNSARLVGGYLTYAYNSPYMWTYIAGQLTGAVAAAALAVYCLAKPSKSSTPATAQ